ncbi:MAG: N-acetylmuramoyl-L-alanine amidase [Actinomycetales bacterium]|nr:N-acetylmuramoyl-L-alanine amidase [Actinomycetales bacterium]
MEAALVRRIAGMTVAGLLLSGLVVPVLHVSTHRSPVSPSVVRIPVAAASDRMASRLGSEPATSLTPAGARTSAAAPVAHLLRTDTAAFGLVALTWDGPDHGLSARIRVRESGQWQQWHVLAASADGPDAGSADARRAAGRSGTDPMLTSGSSDGVEAVVTTRSGRLPAGLHVLLIDGRRTAADLSAAAQGVAAAYADPAAPTIVPRAGWGADETLKSGDPKYSATIKIGFVHHTVTASNYPQSQAAAQVRAVYAYDTLGLGISDMGYNYLVDRFGTIYEGRAGGLEKAVIGAHTAGFNENSFAVAVLGDFHHDRPSSTTLSAVVNAVGSVAGWKLGLFHRDPMSPVALVSTGKYGTSKYDAGEVARMPYSLIGHGDIGATACPGKYLRTQLGLIRQVARKAQSPAIWSPSVSPAAVNWAPGAGTSVAATTSDRMDVTLTVFSACSADPVRSLTTAQSAAGAVSVSWDGRDSAGAPAPPGRYRLVLSGVTDTGAVPWSTSDVVDVDPVPGSPRGPCANVWRTAASGTVADAVAAAAADAPTLVVASSAAAENVNAVAAAALARRLKARFVLADESGFAPSTLAALRDAGLRRAIIVATTGRLASAATALTNLDVPAIERVDGATPTDVGLSAVRKGWGKSRSVTAVVVPTGSPGGVVAAAGAFAASRGYPVVVVPPGKSPSTPAASAAASGTPAGSLSGSPSTSGLPGAAGSPTTSAPPSPTATGTAAGTGSATSTSSVTASASGSAPAPATEVNRALTAAGITATVVVGVSSTLKSPAYANVMTTVQVTGSGSASVALALARKFRAATAVSITTDSASARGYATLAAVLAQPVLVVGSSVSTGVLAWMASAGVTDAVLLGPRTAVPADVVQPLAAAVAPSPGPSPSESATGTGSSSPSASGSSSPSASATTSAPPTATPSPTSGIPLAFAVNGGGFGHGIGMPQYGAQAQAIAGRTAREIIEYYYTGAKVRAVPDGSDIRVNLLHQVSSVTFRTKAVDSSPGRPGDDPAARCDITTNGNSARAAAGDTFTATASMTQSGPRLTLQRTDAQGRTTSLGSFPSVTVRWGGTRDPGDAGTSPAYIDIAGPKESLGDGYGRYRYGTLTVSAVSFVSGGVTKVGLEAVNSVRIHDEYLRGIGEVPASWKPAALQAQIIASRGYALSSLRGGVKPGCDCHVYDNDQSQVFAGWTREVGFSRSAGLARAAATSSAPPSGGTVSPGPSASGSATSGSASASQTPSSSASASASSSVSANASSTPTTSPTPTPTTELPLPAFSLGRAWAKAVLATSPSLTTGLAATVSGKAIASYFYSASAGRTENSEEIWTARLSWARSVPDPWSLDPSVVPERLRAWQVVLSQTDVAAFFGLRDVVRVDIVGRTEGGAVRTLRATSYAGATATANAVTLRKQFDLKSRWFTSIAPFGGWRAPTGSTTPSATGSGSNSPSASKSPWPTRTATKSPSPTNTASKSPTATPTRSASPSSSTSTAPVQVTIDANVPASTTTATTVRGRVARAPRGSAVVVTRKVGRAWKRIAQTAVNGSTSWSARVSLPEGASQLRVEVRLRNRVLATSGAWQVVAASRPVITVRAPASVSVGAVFTLSGAVSQAPAGSVVQRNLKVGAGWQPRGAAVPVKQGSWRMRVTAPRNRGTLTYELVLRTGSKVTARSSTVVIRVK